MSEPTKEQIEKARAFMRRETAACLEPQDLGEQAKIHEADMAFAGQIAIFLAAETAPLHEKIASLEKQLAGALQLSETHRKAWQAAFAPPAQTQQGLSEEEAASLWILLNRPGMTSNKSIALIMERCGRPSNLEKQPSPAAAPAQLSEAIDRFDVLVADYEARSPATRLSAAVKADRKAVNLLRAALAGQPAPEDREALRAAAMEAQHDPVKVARVLELAAATDCGNHWNSDGDPCAAETCLHCRAGELLPELRCRCGKFSLDRSTPSLWEGGATPAPINHAPDECATPAPAKHCPTCAQTVPDGRALAGSPARRAPVSPPEQKASRDDI